MVLKAFTEYTQPPLEVQYEPDGKKYRLPPITIEAAMILHVLAADPGADVQGKDPNDPHWMHRIVLGPLWDEMVTDKVSAEFAGRVYLTALADHANGREHAEKIFAEGVDPLVLKALLEGRETPQEQPKARPASKRSPRTGGASKTP